MPVNKSERLQGIRDTSTTAACELLWESQSSSVHLSSLHFQAVSVIPAKDPGTETDQPIILTWVFERFSGQWSGHLQGLWKNQS